MKKISLKKIRDNYKIWKLLFYFILPIFIVIFVILLSLLNKYHNNASETDNSINTFNEEKSEEDYCDNCVRGLLDGVLTEASKSNPYPVAVVIDNHIDARPPVGLSRAKLVYETEAEGNITRYLAFFDVNDNIDEMGPIRSARPYFVDWTEGLSALLVHCGGSPSALAKIIKENINNLNEFYQTNYFWRSSDNFAPHNIFTSTEKLKEYLEKLDLTNGNFDSWKFKKEGHKGGEINKFKNIKIDFKNRGYEVYWQYDEDNNLYKRFLNNEVHKDAEDNEITAKNLIIQYTSFEVVDSKLRLNIKTKGRGDSVICQDGICSKTIWKKNDSKNRTKYYNLSGEEFYFNPGTTWIEVVNEKYKLDSIYSQIN